MTAIGRMNLACLIWKNTSSVCLPRVSFPFSRRCFSISKEKSTRVYDVLVYKHKLSSQLASQIASDFPAIITPEKADSILSFLNQNGCSTTQLERIVKYRPQVLSLRVDNIQSKIKVFQDLGLSPEDIANMISNNQVILHSSTKNRIIPSLSLLKGFLGSDYDVARLLRKSGRFLIVDLKSTLVPNVEFLISCGIPMDRVLSMMHNFPRVLLIKPDAMRKCIDKVREMGLNQSSKMFIHGVRTIASMSNEAWELKLQAFRDLEFSDGNILTLFRTAPFVFVVSVEKLKEVCEVVLATGKFNVSSIVRNPASLGCSIEKRLKPRLQILGILERKNLFKKWPSLGRIQSLTDEQFYERFIMPYSDELDGAKYYIEDEQ